MWYPWLAVFVVGALGAAVPSVQNGEGVATTRQPPRTLDRQAAELAWRTWLQSPESGNPNAPPRRITTKSLFITPLVCPKGQRLDSEGCVQVLTIDKDEHDRILLEQLNALFTSSPGEDMMYDYGDEEPGPLQLSIPIGLEPQSAPLQANEPDNKVQDVQQNHVTEKKDNIKPNEDASIEAELELLTLHKADPIVNQTNTSTKNNSHSSHNAILPFPDKPKRDSTVVNDTLNPENNKDEGQKEIVFGQVNLDPYVEYNTETEPTTTETITEATTIEEQVVTDKVLDSGINIENNTRIIAKTTETNAPKTTNETSNKTEVKHETLQLSKDADKTKLNPESDYADIGEAIKLISRYAEVTTDDSYKEHNKHDTHDDKEESVLGTRTKLQHRRNKLKHSEPKAHGIEIHMPTEVHTKDSLPTNGLYGKSDIYYRYPWTAQHSATPPPGYPFRHLQDYWPGKNRVGGVYNNIHENPRRHHHSLPYNYFRNHGLFFPNPQYYGGSHAIPQGPYAQSQTGQPSHRTAPHQADPVRYYNNNQDLYSLLGLRHWFSSEGATKR